MIEPLSLDWEKDAIKELADMLNLVAQGEFETVEAFCDRMAASNLMIRSMWGESATEQRMALWKAQQAIEQIFNPDN